MSRWAGEWVGSKRKGSQWQGEMVMLPQGVSALLYYFVISFVSFQQVTL